MKILLTGCEGFVGQHLFKFLTNQKHEVICLDKTTGNDLLSCDLKYSVDLVIHLAGLSGVRDSLGRPEEYWVQNVIAGQRLFDFFKDTRILYASSSTAHEPWKNPYAMSKYSLERIAPANSMGMRFTTVYGPNARETMLIPRILRNDVPYINTNHSRDFIHVEDILTAIGFLIVNKPPRKRKVIDVGTGASHNLLDILSHLNMEVKDKRMGTIFERKDNKANIGTLTKMGWMPTIDLFDYLKGEKDGNI